MPNSSDNHSAALGPVMLDVAGSVLSDRERERLRHPQVAGVILFSKNHVNRSQLVELIDEIRSIRADLLLAVDQEGGRIQRFGSTLTDLPAAGWFGRHYLQQPAETLLLLRESAFVTGHELAELGFDFSFAPVVDLDYGRSAVIGSRAYHRDPELVTVLASAWIDGMRQVGMAAVGKHFPGHGWVSADSHLELPEDERPLSDIIRQDLFPYARLIDQLDAIMPAHVRYPAVDPLPAGFSAFWLRQLLRERLGFEGVIISDDLSMQGAVGMGDLIGRANAALEAGCELLLLCNCGDEVDPLLRHLEQQRFQGSTRLGRLRRAGIAAAAEQQQRVLAAREALDRLRLQQRINNGA